MSPDAGDVIASRRFAHHDQEWFAAASGDHNPMHVDAVRARRTIFGQQVVHGVHVLLWALDAFCAEHATPITGVTVTFTKPVFLDEEVCLTERRSDGTSTKLNVTVGGATLTAVRVDHVARAREPLVVVDPAATDSMPTSVDITGSLDAVDLTIEQISGLRGTVDVPAAPAVWAAAFPALAAAVGADAVADLASLSTIVGMRCPGLHSVFGGLDVHVLPDGETSGRLAPGTDFDVTRADARFLVVKMSVASPRITGNLTAFVRPRPSTQPDTAALAHRVESGEFSDIRALVVGGSRGLGEVTAKLIAAGGGEVTITWHRGRDDAERVAADIASDGGRVSTTQLDIGADAAFPDVGSPTHLFYFASPRVTDRRLVAFDDAAFERFLAAYVSGFLDAANSVVAATGEPICVFYPSSVFVEVGTPDTVEYAAAKAAGEVVASRWAAVHPGSTVHIERLPPAATDQTSAIVPITVADSVDVMLEVLRRLSHENVDSRD